MKPIFTCITQLTRSRLILAPLLGLIAVLLMAGCSGATPATPTAQIVTVPVEVTRIVEVVKTVEITREVLATVIVEVPATAETTTTNSSPTSQPTAILPYRTPTMAYAFETPKASGSSRLKINNETDETLTLKISSVHNYYQLDVGRGKSAFLNVPYGKYTVAVYQGTKHLYSETVSCETPHKYEVNLGASKGKVIYP